MYKYVAHPHLNLLLLSRLIFHLPLLILYSYPSSAFFPSSSPPPLLFFLLPSSSLFLLLPPLSLPPLSLPPPPSPGTTAPAGPGVRAGDPLSGVDRKGGPATDQSHSSVTALMGDFSSTAGGAVTVGGEVVLRVGQPPSLPSVPDGI